MKLPRSKPRAATRIDSLAPLVLFFLPAVAVMNVYFTQPIVGTIAEHYRVSSQAAASSYTVANIGYCMALLFYGTLGACFGSKRAMAAAGMLLGVPLLIPVTYYHDFLSLRLAQGVFAAAIPAIGMAYIRKAYPHNARLHGLFVAGLLFGSMTSRVFGGIGSHYLGVEPTVHLGADGIPRRLGCGRRLAT